MNTSRGYSVTYVIPLDSGDHTVRTPHANAHDAQAHYDILCGDSSVRHVTLLEHVGKRKPIVFCYYDHDLTQA